MGLFTRFTDIVNANLNNLLDKAEQPEKMIRLIIQEMEETLVEVRATAAKNIAENKTLARQLKSATSSVSHWQSKAELALAKNRDDLAKSALVQKHKYQEELESLQSESKQLNEFLSDVQEDAQRLQTKLTEAKRKQESFNIRQQSAEVRLKIREKATIHNINDAISKFECYQQKIDQVEAQVEAYDLTKNQDLASQIDALEKDDDLERELAQLKKHVVNA